jgi:asparagine synthase (glutamine-hydrolysing)
MANSLEVRVPLLDHHVVELAANMPPDFKLKPLAEGVERKHVLKNLARRWYPEDLISRKKMGFGIPVGDWMAEALKDQTEQRLLRSPVLPRLFDMSYVAEIWQRHVAHRDRTNHLWNLLFLDEWMRSHEDALEGL